MSDEVPRAILFVAERGFCSGCGAIVAEDGDEIYIDISEAESGRRDWKVKGTGRFEAQCPECGAMVPLVEHRIPLYTGEFVCPSCHQPGELDVRLTKLSKNGSDFEFEATLLCKPCNKKSKVRKILEKILSIVSIEVGLTGVKVKGSGKAAAE